MSNFEESACSYSHIDTPPPMICRVLWGFTPPVLRRPGYLDHPLIAASLRFSKSSSSTFPCAISPMLYSRAAKSLKAGHSMPLDLEAASDGPHIGGRSRITPSYDSEKRSRDILPKESMAGIPGLKGALHNVLLLVASSNLVIDEFQVRESDGPVH